MRLCTSPRHRMACLWLLVVAGLSATTAAAQQDYRGDPLLDDLVPLSDPEDPAARLDRERLTEQALRRMRDSLRPLSSGEVRELRREERDFERALYDSPALESLTDILQVSTRPGAQPVTVKVAKGQVSALSLIDATGEPWPINAVTVGNSADYVVTAVDGAEYKNVITVAPMRVAGRTNLTILLPGMSVPIPVALVNSEQAFHPAPVLQVDRDGPNARPVVGGLASVPSLPNDDLMKRIVIGVPPEGAQALLSSDPAVEAWRIGDELYLRTQYAPVSPLARAYHHGPGGYAAYRMAPVPIVVMAADDGGERRITFNEPEDY